MHPRLRVVLVVLAITPWTAPCDSCSACYQATQSMGPLHATALGTLPGSAINGVKPEDLGPFDGTMLRYAGEVDFQNHYSASVMITTGNPETGAQCSGVLLGPRLALTAGSCVCQPRKAMADPSGGHIIDASTCASRAYIVTVVYKRDEGQMPGRDILAYEGAVRPHPGLAVLLDARSSVATSRADLAVILLEIPIESSVSYASLADSEVAADESLVMVGYGHDERIEQAFGSRYFRRNKVARPPPLGSDRFSYAELGVDIHGNHGGWPCFRETGKGRWLVGIASKASGEGLSCISTQSHRTWLRTEIEYALTQGGK